MSVVSKLFRWVTSFVFSTAPEQVLTDGNDRHVSSTSSTTPTSANFLTFDSVSCPASPDELSVEDFSPIDPTIEDELLDWQEQVFIVMRDEFNRLASFSDWPGESTIPIDELARCGLFSNGDGTHIQCAFCRYLFSDYSSTTNPLQMHLSANRNCDFLLGRSVGNLPACPEATRMMLNEAMNLRSVEETPFFSNQSSENYFNTPEKVQMDYRTLDSRLESFKNWPKASIVSPAKLAEAGFYSLSKYLQWNFYCPLFFGPFSALNKHIFFGTVYTSPKIFLFYIHYPSFFFICI